MTRWILSACAAALTAGSAIAGGPPPKLRVLVIDGAPRWEYRHLRARLERQPDAFEARFMLLSADPCARDADANALRVLPVRPELDQFDVIILGDFAPKDLIGAHDLSGFVQTGGGLVLVPGPNYGPNEWKDRLDDVLPVRPAGRPAPAVERTKGYRPVLTAAGKKHPEFAYKADGPEDRPWDQLPELYGWASGYVAKPGAEILAVHPTEKTEAGDPLPLVVQQPAGKGRVVFVGFDETWRWQYRTEAGWHAHYWTELLRSVARGR
jgi:hypothetical protein